ncbi:MAG TPA: hypothetical protein VM925_13145 [Labilithrix sp.]|nr:hypothetical protein [Labilithrix sp.]
MPDTNIIWIVVALVAIAAVVSIVFARQSRQRTAALRGRFGPEYDRAVEQYGGKAGERALADRARRVEQIEFRDLSDTDRERFTSSWTAIQAQFVDDPGAAVARANDLIKEVMRARGYSADAGFEQRAEELSVDHPDVVQHYRAARELARARTEHEGVNTEELRQAVVHYRVLFADLLQPARPAVSGVLRPAGA